MGVWLSKRDTFCTRRKLVTRPITQRCCTLAWRNAQRESSDNGRFAQDWLTTVVESMARLGKMEIDTRSTGV